MPKITRVWGLFILLMFVLSGCSGNLAQSERFYLMQYHWGQSQEYVKLRQTMDPEAGLQRKPVTGLDGSTADIILNKHEERFAQDVDPEGKVSKGVGHVN